MILNVIRTELDLEKLYDELMSRCRDESDTDTLMDDRISLSIDAFTSIIRRNPKSIACKQFRSLTVSPGRDAKVGDRNAWLLVIRGIALDGSKIVSFTNATSVSLCIASFMHQAVKGEVSWKPDENRGASGGGGGFLDAITKS